MNANEWTTTAGQRGLNSTERTEKPMREKMFKKSDIIFVVAVVASAVLTLMVILPVLDRHADRVDETQMHAEMQHAADQTEFYLRRYKAYPDDQFDFENGVEPIKEANDAQTFRYHRATDGAAFAISATSVGTGRIFCYRSADKTVRRVAADPSCIAATESRR